MSDDQLTSALNLMRRMPPSSVENSLAGLIELVPQLTDDLLNHVDQPLKVQKDTKSGKHFILCDYNRDGDSYRSPWSNQYFPEMEDGFLPTQRLRSMEIEANAVFDTYRKLYFEGGYSSVYFFNTDEKDDKAFGACFLIHKDVSGQKGLASAWWDSIHVFEVSETDKKGHFEYKLTTTVMVSMKIQNDSVGGVDLTGSMTQQSTQVHAVDDKEKFHLAHLGKMLEEMELKVRSSIEGVYIQKTREVIGGMHTASAGREQQWSAIAQSLRGAVAAHGAQRKTDSD